MTDYEREAKRQQVAENSGRLAFAYGQSTTTGSGQLVHPEQIDFGCTFVERPMFSYGFVVIETEVAFDDDAAYFPASSGFVFEYQQDERGLYIGAHVGVRVDAGDNDVLEHHFTFQGIAIKDLAIRV